MLDRRKFLTALPGIALLAKIALGKKAEADVAPEPKAWKATKNVTAKEDAAVPIPGDEGWCPYHVLRFQAPEYSDELQPLRFKKGKENLDGLFVSYREYLEDLNARGLVAATDSKPKEESSVSFGGAVKIIHSVDTNPAWFSCWTA